MPNRMASAAAVPVGVEEQRASEESEGDDARRLVENVFGNLKGELAQAESRLAREFEGLARFIENAKTEIATLRPDDITHHHLPKVAVELDAIAEATEKATNSIMAAAETIERLTAGLEPALAERISQSITAIYEACGFQDISGQRITKVVKTLKRIDDRVAVLVASIEEELQKQRERDSDEPGEREGYAGEPELLSGPQSGAAAKSQDEIDSLLSSLKRQ
jgi:chemotaxis protein CheZ